MSSPIIDSCSSTAEELENIDYEIIDDQAIDREIASAFNLPVDDMEAVASEPEGRIEIDPALADNDRQFDDRMNDDPPKMGYYGYALNNDRNYGHDMDQPANHGEPCRGAPCQPTPFGHDSEMFSPPPNQRDHDPSIIHYGNGNPDRTPTANMSNENMHPNHPTHPMYHGSRQFSNGRYPANGQNEYYHPESSMDLAHDSYIPPWAIQQPPPPPAEYLNPNEPPSYGTSRPTARPKRRRGRPSKRAGTAQRSSESYMDVIPPPLPTELDTVPENGGLARGLEDDIAIRGAGINDPDNIRIVNLHDNENKTWNEISNLLNADHISKGADPCFTPNNVHNRYNRNAPVLCAAEGVKFVPIKDRKKHGVIKRQRQKPRPSEISNWSNHFDELLVQAHNEVKSWYWKQIAIKFEESGGFRITGDQAAYRMRLI